MQAAEHEAAASAGPPTAQQENAVALNQDPSEPSSVCAAETPVVSQEPNNEPAATRQPPQEPACSDAVGPLSRDELGGPESAPSTAAADALGDSSACTPSPEPAQSPPESHQELQPAQEAAASEYLVPGMRVRAATCQATAAPCIMRDLCTSRSLHPTTPTCPFRPQALTVEVDEGGGLPCRMVRVEIDATAVAPKPFIGGYKHRGSGATYHHAAQQVGPWRLTGPGVQVKGCLRRLRRHAVLLHRSPPAQHLPHGALWPGRRPRRQSTIQRPSPSASAPPRRCERLPPYSRLNLRVLLPASVTRQGPWVHIAAAPPLLRRARWQVDTSTRSAQTLREQGTQMAKRGLHLDTSGDR